MQVDLLYFPSKGQPAFRWELGDTRVLHDTLRTMAPGIDAWLQNSTADYCLFWDMELGLPDPMVVTELLESPIDVWHGGLELGLAGQPELIDFVNPTWMLNHDVDSNLESSSWRMSLRAALIRVDVLRQLGSIDTGFDTLDGASLDLGHRFLTRGVFIRHTPALLKNSTKRTATPTLTVYDQLRFIGQQYGRKWVNWSIARGLLTGFAPFELQRAWRRLRQTKGLQLPAPYKRTSVSEERSNLESWHEKITVLIPTLERYSYLRNELFQLRKQTVRPLEIIVVDQTPAEERDLSVADEFRDLPLRIFYQDTLGQCTAWNEALIASKGEYILFLGDDADRIGPDFLERFMQTFQAYRADMVASLVDEVGAGPPPFGVTFTRISDIFPIAMVRREVFKSSGLMDFAFDRAKRADADLGMRCYGAGALMILNPEIRLLHHRAPRGGLRKHNVRVHTYASSKKSLRQRNLPSASEIYLTLRHFSKRQIREELWLRVFGSMSVSGSRGRKALGIILGFLFLPTTLWQVHQKYRDAVTMMDQFPQIPELPEKTEQSIDTSSGTSKSLTAVMS